MTGHFAKFGPVDAAAEPIVHFATLCPNGPSGLFFDPKKQQQPW
jgi:hypothetical protein